MICELEVYYSRAAQPGCPNLCTQRPRKIFPGPTGIKKAVIKNPGTAAVLSFLIPRVGQIYNGKFLRARHFVVTAAHTRGEKRLFQSESLGRIPATVPAKCDLCSSQDLAEKVEAGLPQKTCTACHTEFLSVIALAT
jgi:hypothetical protein